MEGADQRVHRKLPCQKFGSALERGGFFWDRSLAQIDPRSEAKPWLKLRRGLSTIHILGLYRCAFQHASVAATFMLIHRAIDALITGAVVTFTSIMTGFQNTKNHLCSIRWMSRNHEKVTEPGCAMQDFGIRSIDRSLRNNYPK